MVLARAPLVALLSFMLAIMGSSGWTMIRNHTSNSLAQFTLTVPERVLGPPEFFTTQSDGFIWEPYLEGALIKAVNARARRQWWEDMIDLNKDQKYWQPWAAVRWKVDATPWIGLRVQLLGRLATKNMARLNSARPVPDWGNCRAGLFIRVVNEVGVTLDFDNMIKSVVCNYKEVVEVYSLVIDVPGEVVKESPDGRSCIIEQPAFIHMGFYLNSFYGTVQLLPGGTLRMVDKSTRHSMNWDKDAYSIPGIW